MVPGPDGLAQSDASEIMEDYTQIIVDKVLNFANLFLKTPLSD
jgi:hypothetical protein